ncbi:3-deoxy-manno-octulosonate cytidylyltransferase [Planctomycetes bacterium K23_9]|uniref:3-deoxy-manno-octulosonate cytidylyltransferase n=1 Tax=Stieleria marina TaxID=1930275 RepID=A0A517NPC4_9BACT|nr:3-deoxy-manno-octulosonate cytidylyltransferase [Planctomycetes bacterium K23_9]
MHCQIVIPARLASTRLPEKLLRRAGSKSVLQHTFDAASASDVASGVIVAVDDQRIADEVESFGGRWIMTNPDCPSGTDRIAEVAAAMPNVDVFVNVQGDEPEISPAAIDLVAQALIDAPQADMSTVGTPIRNPALLDDPSVVKIVLALNKNSAGQGRAVYFSRSVVPHVRDGVTDEVLAAEPPIFWHHLGLYAYRREFLSWFAAQPPSQIEQSERLEQLRAIEAGKTIAVARVESATPGIDTQADLDAFIDRLATSK